MFVLPSMRYYFILRNIPRETLLQQLVLLNATCVRRGFWDILFDRIVHAFSVASISLANRIFSREKGTDYRSIEQIRYLESLNIL